jgi:D-alanyl-lipoteichoic acid acyltransferase DltB (MBOAT superfamily)
MLFNSYIFLFLFLPVVLSLFHALRQLQLQRSAFAFLAAASLAFYAWWSLWGLLLLLVLMSLNYLFVSLLLRCQVQSRLARLTIAVTGIALNLAVLGYFKYANFFLENWSALTGRETPALAILLPLGLSFFTFQKIALLADAYSGRVTHFEPLGYTLFVSFFPQLIAGPIVHHSEVMPQFAKMRGPTAFETAEGLTLFTIGLAKKVLGADSLGPWVSPVFDSVSPGTAPAFAEAWGATLAYTLQLYLDFSGYSDMALGLGLLFGVRLPINFNSPYKAANIVEFWRRWHMTLSRFLRDYLYIPLGGNRHGKLLRYGNLMITMLLGGLWHGASWTFVIWGALHGFYLIVNHAWSALIAWRYPNRLSTAFTRGLARGLTFLSVMAGWVFFRAPDVHSATSILGAMLGNGGSGIGKVVPAYVIGLVVALLLLVWFLPNSQQIAAQAVGRSRDARDIAVERLSSWQWAAASGLLLALCLMGMTRVTEFLYFQF